MYKKTYILIAAAVMVIAFSGSAFATTNDLPPVSNSFKYSTSSDVSFYYTTDASTTGSQTSIHYVMNSKNKAGNRVFSSSDNTSKVYYKENDVDLTGKCMLATSSPACFAVGATYIKTTSGAVDSSYTGWTAL